jgi:integrase
MHAAIAKPVNGVGGRYVANRAVAILSAIFGWADGAGLVPEDFNPTRRVERFQERSRERYLTTAELERLGAVLREAETTGLGWTVDETKPTAKHIPKASRATVLPVQVTAAIRLLIFTGCRLREVLNLEWRDVDMERGLLLLPDSKTGKKTIVLASPALVILESLPRIGRFVIAGDTAGKADEVPRADLKRPWAAVTKAAGLKGLRLHDLRHTFASIGVGGGLGLPVIGGLLGHADVKTTQRYAHLDADPARVAANVIAGKISAALGGSNE